MDNVPPEFREYGERVLDSEWIGKRVGGVICGKTPLNQYFALVTSKVVWYAVRLIVDEEHRDLELAGVFNVHNENVLLKKEFFSYDEAMKYVAEIKNKLENGSFDDVSVQIRRLPPDAYFFPDKYLKPGDHIQRSLIGPNFVGNHEAVYLGEGLVAHINGSTDATDLISLYTCKMNGDAYARIDRFEKFAGDESKEIRVLVHCIRRRTREDICEMAQRLADGKYRRGEYHLLQKNCQHFASLCVIGEEWMSDMEKIQEGVQTAARITAGAAIFATIGYAAYSTFFSQPVEDKERSQVAKTKQR